MTTHNEDIWTCTQCHSEFGRHDMYFDGVCEKCNTENIKTEKKIHRMVLACTNASGEPDFAFVKVQCTDEQCDECDDSSRAIEWAEENDYEAPFVVFNCEEDSAGRSIVDCFTWETASLVSV